MPKYKQKTIEYEAMTYTGNVEDVRNFGVTVADDSSKDIHVHIITKDGIDKACPVGHCIVKDQFGNVEICSSEDFANKFQEVVI